MSVKFEDLKVGMIVLYSGFVGTERFTFDWIADCLQFNHIYVAGSWGDGEKFAGILDLNKVTMQETDNIVYINVYEDGSTGGVHKTLKDARKWAFGLLGTLEINLTKSVVNLLTFK